MGDTVAYDRGHMIPANHFDGDAAKIYMTNAISNIIPQIGSMNRGAWLKTEAMTECYRNIQPLYVVGGAVFYDAANSDNAPLPPNWNNVDRTDWMLDSHGIATGAYNWKLVVFNPVPGDSTTPITSRAFWIENSKESTASNVDSYVVTINELETLLAAWGAPETFAVGDVGAKDSVTTGLVDFDYSPSGCSSGR